MRLLRVVSFMLVCALAANAAVAPARTNFATDINAQAASDAAQPGVSSSNGAVGADVTMTDHAASAAPPQKHGNAFWHALAAPFRALARLFGGRKKDATAKRAPAPARPTQVAAAPQVEPAPIPEPVLTNTARTQSSIDAQQRTADARKVRPEVAGGNTPTFTERPAPTAPAPLPQPQTQNIFTPILEGVARDPLSQGRALLERGDTNEAIAQLSVAAVTGPDLIAANNLLGLAYDRLGQHKLAQDAYERALTAAPKDAATLNNLGYSLYLDDRYADALARLKSAARLDPANRQVANNLALVYGRLQKFDDAYRSFARAGGELYARVQTGALLEAAGRDIEAIKHFESARRLAPANSEVLRRLINLYVRTGQPGKAEDARRLLEKIPEDKRSDGATSSSSV
ncbi:MAG: tetratricopeptide repeat protein [Pyrinomonadaceae bacterium]